MTGSETREAVIRQAASLGRAGRLTEAMATYERLLARWPDLADSWYNLALLQRQTGRFDAALSSYQQALEHGVSDPEQVHLNRGVIYSDCLRNDDAAEKELKTALRLNPNYVPAFLNLANLKEDHGDRAEALGLYERVLALDAGCYDALARYANLKTGAGRDDPLIERLNQAIALPDTNAADKANLSFALGKTLDACGAYDQAFEAFAMANRHSRAGAAAGSAPYNRRRHEQFVDLLIETFTPDRFNSSAPPIASAPPIFICGMFRSGSTLVEQVLASHPRVTAGGEIGFIPALVHSELAPFPAAMSRTSAAKLAAIARQYHHHLARLFPGADLITDKRPDNFLYIGLIKALFPNARIINTTRNPLDNCLSVYFLHLHHSMAYAFDLMDTAHYYRQYRRLMAHWKTLFGPDILDFDYDAFVREQRPATERLLDFCGLPWDEACMSFHRTKNAVKTESVWQVRQPLYERASGRWRNYARHVEPLRAYLSDT